MKNIAKLVIATHNPGKLKEIRDLLAPLGIECVSAAELGLPEPEEIGTSFIDNADLKAREAADLSGLPALADDSGLAVDALHGLPGIFSARWAEDEAGNRDFGRAMRMSKRLDFGCVWINAHIPLVAEMPHGGFKKSGYGKDLSAYGFDDYTRIKHVMTSLDA